MSRAKELFLGTLLGYITAYMRAGIQLGVVSREWEINKTEFSKQCLDFNI